MPSLAAGRFRLAGLIRPDLDPGAWRGSDAETDRAVVACLVTPAVGVAARKRRRLAHPRLVPVVDVVPARQGVHPPLEDCDPRGERLVVLEPFQGSSLEELVRLGGAMPPEAAVRVALDVAVGLAAIHAAGGFHGTVTPLAVEVLDDGRARLGFAGVQDAAIAYQSPRRITDGELSASDDAWALVACLYFAVTGDAPFRGESAGAIARRVLGGHPLPIRATTPAEQALQKVFDRAFSRVASRHYRDVATLSDELRAWLREHAPASEPIDPADTSTVAETPAPSPKASSLPPPADPPPALAAPSLPPAASPHMEATPVPPAAPPRVEGTPIPVAESTPALRVEAVPAPPEPAGALEATDGLGGAGAREAGAGAAARTMGAVLPAPPAQPIVAGPPPRARTGKAGAIAALAAGGLAIAGAALYVARPGLAPPAASSVAAAGPSVEPPPRAPAAVPAGTASADTTTASTSAGVSPAVDLDACIGAWFPPESFDPDTDLTFVCTERDGRRGAGRLRRAILAGGKGKKVTDAMREWGRFGWFELPVYATLRASCCPGAPPLDVPRVAGSSCTPPHDAIQALAAVTAQHGDVGTAVRGYRKVVSCLVEMGDYPAYGQPGAIGTAEEPAFRAFAERGRAR